MQTYEKKDLEIALDHLNNIFSEMKNITNFVNNHMELMYDAAIRKLYSSNFYSSMENIRDSIYMLEIEITHYDITKNMTPSQKSEYFRGLAAEHKEKMKKVD